jgi:hypothetical protein
MGRANAIRPYKNPRNPVNPDSKPNCKHTKSKQNLPPEISEIHSSEKYVIQNVTSQTVKKTLPKQETQHKETSNQTTKEG